MRQSFVVAGLVVSGLMLSISAYAELQGRLPAASGGTDYQAVYDTVRDIIWRANGNAGAGVGLR